MMENKDNLRKPKIIVILGPTATGKSDLGVRLAKEFNGEIVSADSSQVYKGLDIGSGKITEEEMQEVPHYLLDVISPIDNNDAEVQKKFSVAEYQSLAYETIDKIIAKNKLPIVVGGTAFYIQSIVDGTIFPEVPASPDIREELDGLSILELQNKLSKIDPKRFSQIDIKNRVRLVRSIEIALLLGKVPELESQPKYNCLQIGLNLPKEVLYKKIEIRLNNRLQNGMLEEARSLHQNGLSWAKMKTLGIEYKYQAEFLQNNISKEKMIEEINYKSRQFAKRQMTWFKKDERIKWFDPSNYDEILTLVKNW